MATLAGIGIDNRTEEGEAGEKAQGCTHGADCVAPGAAVPPRKDRNDNEGRNSHNGDKRAHKLTACGSHHLAKESVRIQQDNQII